MEYENNNDADNEAFFDMNAQPHNDQAVNPSGQVHLDFDPNVDAPPFDPNVDAPPIEEHVP
jgi:hypothetical protein